MAPGAPQRRTKIGTGHDPKARCFLFNKTGGYFRRSSLSSPCFVDSTFRRASRLGAFHPLYARAAAGGIWAPEKDSRFKSPVVIQVFTLDGPIVAIPQVGSLRHRHERIAAQQDTILLSNPSFACSVFAVKQLNTVGERLRTESQYFRVIEKNCDVAKRARIEFLVGTGAR